MKDMVWWPARLATAWEWQWGRLCFRYVHLEGGGWTGATFVDRFTVYLEKRDG